MGNNLFNKKEYYSLTNSPPKTIFNFELRYFRENKKSRRKSNFSKIFLSRLWNFLVSVNINFNPSSCNFIIGNF